MTQADAPETREFQYALQVPAILIAIVCDAVKLTGFGSIEVFTLNLETPGFRVAEWRPFPDKICDCQVTVAGEQLARCATSINSVCVCVRQAGLPAVTVAHIAADLGKQSPRAW